LVKNTKNKIFNANFKNEKNHTSELTKKLSIKKMNELFYVELLINKENE